MATRRAVGSFFDMFKPWRWTGPASSAEYLDATPFVGESSMYPYRLWSPASPPKELAEKISIPRKDPNHVYDIKYFNRDARRAGTIGGTRAEVTAVQKAGAAELSHVALAAGVPPPPGPPQRYTRRPAYEYDNQGYT